MRVKNRSGKRDFKYKRERDNAFLRGRDAEIVRYSMAGYGITVPCTRKTLSQGVVDLTEDVGHSVLDADDGDEYESSSSAEEEEFKKDVELQKNKKNTIYFE